MQTTETQALYLIGAAPVDPPGKKASKPASSINFDETYNPRPLACKQCGWIYGVVMRVKLSNKTARRLWVFTEAIDEAAHVPAWDVLRSGQPGVFRIHGLDHCEDGIECSNCGWLNTWSKSLESYLRLASHYSRSGND